MAFDIWKGPGGTSGKPKSGDFADGSNWSTGAAPNAASVNVVMGAGKYSVTLTSATYTMGSLTIGGGVTFNLSGPGSSPASIGVNGDSTNSGVISNLGSVFGIGTGVTLLNLGTIYGVGSDTFIAQFSGGTIQNAGLISTNGGPAFGDMGIFSRLINDAGGVVGTVGGGKTALLGSVTNDGLIAAVDAGLITFSSLGYTGSSTNFVDGVLTGGAWSAVGLNSTLDLRGAAIKEIATGAVVTLKGAGSQIQSSNAEGTVGIQTSLGIIGDSATLIIKDRDYTTAQDLDVSGLLTLEGGTLTSQGMTIHDNTGCALTGYGVVNAGSFDIYGAVKAVKNAGQETLNLQGDSLIMGTLSGPGTLELSSGHVQITEGARVQSKSILLSGADLELDTDLVYDNRLTMTAGSIDTDGFLLRLKGVVTLGGGSEITGPGALQVEGAYVKIAEGGATIYSALRNDGFVDVAQGSLTQLGVVNGIGAFAVGAGDTLTFAAYVGAGQQIVMAGRNATLDLQNPDSFHGTVADLGARETIHLEGFEAVGAKLSFKADSDGQGGTLKLSSGLDKITFDLDGVYVQSGFHLADLGDGSADLTYASPTGALEDADSPLDAYLAGHDGWVI